MTLWSSEYVKLGVFFVGFPRHSLKDCDVCVYIYILYLYQVYIYFFPSCQGWILRLDMIMISCTLVTFVEGVASHFCTWKGDETIHYRTIGYKLIAMLICKQ